MKEKSFITRQEIAGELGIDVKTLRRCIKKYDIDLKPGLLPVGVANEIKEIFKKIKLPVTSLNIEGKFDGIK
jgi:hypothetical protein